MISFTIQIWRLLVAARQGVKKDGEFRALLILLMSLLVGATYFYWHVEGWSVVDSLYFSVMTMTTIGYGDLAPSTPLSKIFTIVFAISSIGVFVATASKLVAIILDQKRIKKQKKTKVKK